MEAGSRAAGPGAKRKPPPAWDESPSSQLLASLCMPSPSEGPFDEASLAHLLMARDPRLRALTQRVKVARLSDMARSNGCSGTFHSVPNRDRRDVFLAALEERRYGVYADRLAEARWDGHSDTERAGVVYDRLFRSVAEETRDGGHILGTAPLFRVYGLLSDFMSRQLAWLAEPGPDAVDRAADALTLLDYFFSEAVAPRCVTVLNDRNRRVVWTALQGTAPAAIDAVLRLSAALRKWMTGQPCRLAEMLRTHPGAATTLRDAGFARVVTYVTFFKDAHKMRGVLLPPAFYDMVTEVPRWVQKVICPERAISFMVDVHDAGHISRERLDAAVDDIITATLAAPPDVDGRNHSWLRYFQLVSRPHVDTALKALTVDFAREGAALERARAV